MTTPTPAGSADRAVSVPSGMRRLARFAGGLANQVLQELVETARRPARILGLVRPEKLRRVARRVIRRGQNASLGGDWSSPLASRSIVVRTYESYDTYVEHQKRKLTTLDLTSYQERFRAALRGRLEQTFRAPPPASVLCLGARLGAEVQAFHDLKHLAVGIDLNPGKDNPYVLPGDFHAIVFPDDSFDLVYTNTLDHALDLDRLLAEIDRVLAPKGSLLIEVAESSTGGEYEVLAWTDLASLLAELAKRGWVERQRLGFIYPWEGWQVELVRVPAA